MIYLILKGSAQLKVGEKNLKLEEKNYCLIPASLPRSFHTEDECIALMITFKKELMIQNMDKEQVLNLETEIP